ncbi:hypothetical protein ACHWQZ_G003487 [Mnemiopsis leidyi]
MKLLILLVCSVALGASQEFKISNKEFEQFEGATDATLIMNDPVAINARKMSRLLKRQDVVANCRYLLFKAYKNFWDAKSACRNLQWPFTNTGIDLASVNSEVENKEIRILLQIAHGIKQVGKLYNRDNWVWVGLEKKVNNKVLLAKKDRGSSNFNASEWEWLDGSNPRFSHWMKDMPDQEYKRKYRDYQNHVMINKRGRWDDTFPEIEAPYACNYCGKYIVVAQHVKWTTARALCESYGLTMAIVNSKEDNVELGWAANITFGPDPEHKRWNNTNWIWLGTEEVMDEETGEGTGDWIHHDGSELEWSPVWDRKQQPDNWVTKRGEQRVVAFSRINQKWDDSFVWRKRPFACMCPHRTCTFD